MASSKSAKDKNAVLRRIGRDIFQYELSKFLLPYERFLLAATCKWLNAIFNINNRKLFLLHAATDFSLIKHDIIDKYIGKRKVYRQTANCLDLSHGKYTELTRHQRLCMKYVLIYLQNLPECFPMQHCFQNQLMFALKMTFSSNDSAQSDSIIDFLSHILTHKKSNVQNLLHSLHLDDIGMRSSPHLDTLTQRILCCTSNIRYLYLADNPGICDHGMADLFACIAAHTPLLEVLDISGTSVSDQTCRVIYEFCRHLRSPDDSRRANDAEGISSSSSSQPTTESTSADDGDEQEVVYMSSEEENDDDGDDEESDFDLKTDDEFDTIVEKKLVHHAVSESLKQPFPSKGDHKECNDDHLQCHPDEPNQVTVNLKWIDLKNNKKITTKGVDILNEIYVQKLQPTSAFVLYVEGCSYEPNVKWDLSLL